MIRLSNYTTELRYIIESRIGLQKSLGYNNVNDIINQGRKCIFNFSYPIYDENYRGILETKIIKHFYTREIAFESVGRWNLALDEKMNLIMPYYNTLYKINIDSINPLEDVRMLTEHKKEDTGVQDSNSNTESTNNTEVHSENTTNSNSQTNSSYDDNSSSNTSSTNKNAFSNTPQGSLSNVDNNAYLTDYRKIEDSGNTETDTHHTDESTNNVNSNTIDNSNSSGISNSVSKQNIQTSSLENYIESVTGKSAGHTYGAMYKDFIDALINIDAMIINDLEELFMQVWGMSE